MPEDRLYHRYLEPIIRETLEKGSRSILLYGPRQVGKTTLAKKFVRDGRDVYFSCDDISIARSFLPNTSALQNLVRPFERIVIDEAQHIRDAGRVLKLLIDAYPEKRFIITGSSALELAYGSFDALTGRVHIHEMYPIAVAEFPHLEKATLGTSPELLSSLLTFGSYPGVLVAPQAEKQETITEISAQYLFKDTLAFEMQKRPEFLENLLALIGSQTGSLVSMNSLANALDVGRATVERYVHLTTQLFILRPLCPFHANFKKRITRQSKYFFWDVGIRNALTKNFGDIAARADKGGLWENFIIMERMKYNASRRHACNYYFYRGENGAEVDLIEEADGKINCFEIKYDAGAVSRGVGNAVKELGIAAKDVRIVNRHTFLDFIAR